MDSGSMRFGMAQNETSTPYESYLLRCWQVSPATSAEPAQWRFTLRDVSAEPKEQAFASLAELMSHLAKELGSEDTAS